MNTEQIIQEWERPIREEWEQGDETDTAFLYARIAGLLRAKCSHLLHESTTEAYDELTKVLREWADDTDPETIEKIYEAMDRAHRVGYGYRKESEVEA